MTLNPALVDCNGRSKAVAEALEALRQKGVIQGWRNELYPVGRQATQRGCSTLG